jgi:hypothetical protein
MDLREIGWSYTDWIHLARDQLRDLVNTVMNLGFHKMLGSSGDLSRGLSSMK